MGKRAVKIEDSPVPDGEASAVVKGVRGVARTLSRAGRRCELVLQRGDRRLVKNLILTTRLLMRGSNSAQIRNAAPLGRPYPRGIQIQQNRVLVLSGGRRVIETASAEALSFDLSLVPSMVEG
jgi:hypothetical protein